MNKNQFFKLLVLCTASTILFYEITNFIDNIILIIVLSFALGWANGNICDRILNDKSKAMIVHILIFTIAFIISILIK